MPTSVHPEEVAGWLADGDEIAFLDVREIVPFGRGHPLLAVHAPLSELELDAARLVPRTGTRVVVTDGEGECAELAADRLARLGYADVRVLAGGAAAWAASGRTLFPEIEVPSKGFGAFVRRHGPVRFVSPKELHAALASGAGWTVLDSRPRDEYVLGNIPGSIDAPGAEALRCFADLVPDRDATVVVNCMSATRGILGGAMLVTAGLANPVRVLHRGTRGWELDGFELERGATRSASAPSAEAVRTAVARATAMLARAGVERIDLETLDCWRRDPTRTTSVVDVRAAEEFARGHLAGAVNAPEGAIVMSPQHYLGTLRARVVLVDDDGVRAGVTALWLAQMGLVEAAALADGVAGATLETGSTAPAPPATPDVRAIAAPDLARMRDRGEARVVDVGRSEHYARAHIAGARWCSRVRLLDHLRAERFAGTTVLTSPDGTLARLAASDVGSEVAALDGGNAAWRAAGHALTDADADYAVARDDFWLASSERPGDVRRNVTSYLEWEESLLDAIESSGESPYRNLLWSRPES